MELIEVGHTYLEDVVYGDTLSDETIEFTERYTDENDAKSVVIVDDTSKSDEWEADTLSFKSFRRQWTITYLGGFEPDFVFFESDFTPIADELLDDVPVLTEDQLNDGDSWGILPNGERIKLYGPQVDGHRESATVIDERTESLKRTRYTCAMYDVAILLAKFGIEPFASPINPVPDTAITIHPEGYVGSAAHNRSRRIQNILQRLGYLRDVEHIEIDGLSEAREKL